MHPAGHTVEKWSASLTSAGYWVPHGWEVETLYYSVLDIKFTQSNQVVGQSFAEEEEDQFERRGPHH